MPVLILTQVMRWLFDRIKGVSEKPAARVMVVWVASARVLPQNIVNLFWSREVLTV